MQRHQKFAAVVAGVAASFAFGTAGAMADTAAPDAADVVQIAQAVDATTLMRMVQEKLVAFGTTVPAATAGQMSAVIAELGLQNRGIIGDIAGMAALARPDLAPEIEMAAVAAAPEADDAIGMAMEKALNAPSSDQLAAVETVTGEPAEPVSSAGGTVTASQPTASPSGFFDGGTPPSGSDTASDPQIIILPVTPGVDGSDS